MPEHSSVTGNALIALGSLVLSLSALDYFKRKKKDSGNGCGSTNSHCWEPLSMIYSENNTMTESDMMSSLDSVTCSMMSPPTPWVESEGEIYSVLHNVSHNVSHSAPYNVPPSTHTIAPTSARTSAPTSAPPVVFSLSPPTPPKSTLPYGDVSDQLPDAAAVQLVFSSATSATTSAPTSATTSATTKDEMSDIMTSPTTEKGKMSDNQTSLTTDASSPTTEEGRASYQTSPTTEEAVKMSDSQTSPTTDASPTQTPASSMASEVAEANRSLFKDTLLMEVIVYGIENLRNQKIVDLLKTVREMLINDKTQSPAVKISEIIVVDDDKSKTDDAAANTVTSTATDVVPDGTNTPDDGTNTPDAATKTPDDGTDTPDAATDTPSAKPVELSALDLTTESPSADKISPESKVGGDDDRRNYVTDSEISGGDMQDGNTFLKFRVYKNNTYIGQTKFFKITERDLQRAIDKNSFHSMFHNMMMKYNISY